MEILFDTATALCRLRKAFQMLRSEGISAHMRLPDRTVPMVMAPKPLVFVTLEDELAFARTGTLPVQFVDTFGDDAGCRALGDMARIILEMHGLTVEWGGNFEKPLMVLA